MITQIIETTRPDKSQYFYAQYIKIDKISSPLVFAIESIKKYISDNGINVIRLFSDDELSTSQVMKFNTRDDYELYETRMKQHLDVVEKNKIAYNKKHNHVVKITMA